MGLDGQQGPQGNMVSTVVENIGHEIATAAF